MEKVSSGEIGKRMPLSEKNMGMQVEYERGKRKQMKGQGKENEGKGIEKQKKYRRISSGTDCRGGGAQPQ